MNKQAKKQQDEQIRKHFSKLGKLSWQKRKEKLIKQANKRTKKH